MYRKIPNSYYILRNYIDRLFHHTKLNTPHEKVRKSFDNYIARINDFHTFRVTNYENCKFRFPSRYGSKNSQLTTIRGYVRTYFWFSVEGWFVKYQHMIDFLHNPTTEDFWRFFLVVFWNFGVIVMISKIFTFHVVVHLPWSISKGFLTFGLLFYCTFRNSNTT